MDDQRNTACTGEIPERMSPGYDPAGAPTAKVCAVPKGDVMESQACRAISGATRAEEDAYTRRIAFQGERPYIHSMHPDKGMRTTVVTTLL